MSKNETTFPREIPLNSLKFDEITFLKMISAQILSNSAVEGHANIATLMDTGKNKEVPIVTDDVFWKGIENWRRIVGHGLDDPKPAIRPSIAQYSAWLAVVALGSIYVDFCLCDPWGIRTNRSKKWKGLILGADNLWHEEECRGHINDRGKFFDVGDDLFGCVAGLLFGLGDHGRIGITHMANFAVRQYRALRLFHRLTISAVDQPSSRVAPHFDKVFTGKDSQDTWNLCGSACVY